MARVRSISKPAVRLRHYGPTGREQKSHLGVRSGLASAFEHTEREVCDSFRFSQVEDLVRRQAVVHAKVLHGGEEDLVQTSQYSVGCQVHVKD